MADHWAEDPRFPHADWRFEVNNGDTLLGYHEWLAERRRFSSPPAERKFRFIRRETVTHTLELSALDVAERLERSMEDADVTVETLTPQWLDDLMNGGGDRDELGDLWARLYDADAEYDDTETRVEEL